MKIFNLVIAGLVKAGLAGECSSTDRSAADSGGDDCSWYTSDRTGYCGSYDTEFFFANSMCCECGGGVTYDCADTNTDWYGNFLGDSTGDGCDWYEGRDSCGWYNYGEFDAQDMCCTCGGGLDLCTEGVNASVGDSFGDGCDWYVGNEAWCGWYDTDSFKANNQCCACQAEAEASVSLISLSLDCTDTANGHADLTGDACDWYEIHGQCDWWNTESFTASSMCCTCEGGSWTATCENDTDAFDSWGDGCEWYTENSWTCGNYNTDDFTAAESCCACQNTYMNLVSYVSADQIYTPIVVDACNDSTSGFTDSWGDSCDWYDANPGSCGYFDTEDFEANSACCGCDGGLVCVDATTGTDSWGDGCDWYVGNEDSCGVFDDPYDNFIANDVCCACKSTYNLNLAAASCSGSDCANVAPTTFSYTAGVCSDLDGTDSWGDSCDWYVNNPLECGTFDHGSWSAFTDCCACQGGLTCADRNADTTDWGGDSCEWYVGMEDWCGFYDDDDFTASTDCCACQSSTDALNLSSVAGCLDSDWASTDSWGDSCDWYVGNEDWCGSYDTVDFTASELCCSCTGGLSHTTTCNDQDEDSTGDITGDKCDWYTEYPSGCGLYDTEDFNSNEMCCACGAGDHVCIDTETTDSWGDGCEWYADNTEWCGLYDDDDFVASNMCCGCPAPSTLNLAMVGTNCYSYEVDYEAADSFGDGCAWYAGNEDLCGIFDHTDFNANEMCCECGAGIPLNDICIDVDFSLTDSTGDSCAWYENMNGECSGFWDTDWFSANDMCCGCGGGADVQCADNAGPFTDLGGDGCEWYVGNEEYCGAFDTEEFTSAACCACMPQLFSWDLAQNLKSDQVITQDNMTQYIVALIAMIAIGAGASYTYGKKSKAEEKKNSAEKAYVKNNVTEKLI